MIEFFNFDERYIHLRTACFRAFIEQLRQAV